MIQNSSYNSTNWHRASYKARITPLKSAPAAPNTRIEPYFLMACQCTDCTRLSPLERFNQTWGHTRATTGPGKLSANRPNFTSLLNPARATSCSRKVAFFQNLPPRHCPTYSTGPFGSHCCQAHPIGLFSAYAKDSPATRAATLLEIKYSNSVRVERPSQRVTLP
jgi:hypothetical protein